MEIVHENLQFYPPTEPSRPPISALDRFLTGQTHSLELLHPQSNDHKEVQMGSGFTEFSSPCGGFGDEFYDLSNPWLLPGLHSDHDYSGIFCDDLDFHGCIISTNIHEMMSESYNNSQKQPPDGAISATKTSGRGRSRPSATTFGKRKWTEDEDRTLVKLVKQYGLKKWACIAQRLKEGRTAKQCRERWQNHLRPDIKKESWSEEEEKMFIEAHEKLGNRWSEIARRIPGRTENAVKNHWNAAKRRRNLQVRGSKKKASDQNLPKPSSLLQDYMKRNNFYGVLSLQPNKPSQATNNVGNEKILAASEHHHTATPISEASTLMTPLEAWEYEYSPLLMTDTVCDEEVMFMLNLFSSSHQADHQPLGLQPPMASWGGGYGVPGDYHLLHFHSAR